jgi:hypothetical protein
VYAVPPVGQGYLALMAGWPSPLMCFNSTAAPGQLRQVARGGVCRNFRARREPAVWTEPPEPPNDAVRYIPLTRGQYAIVDAADFEWLSRYKWHAAPRDAAGGFYARRHEKGRNVWMHREIMNAPEGMVVDHIDGNGLNDRRCNLRLCTRTQNGRNRRKNRDSDNEYKGIWTDKKTGRSYAQIRFEGEQLYLGSFDTAVEAARAYDRKARELFGEFAYLNFPAECDLEPATVKR